MSAAPKNQPKPLTMSLTLKQARFLWQVLDGALDAGSCKGGMSKDEQRTGEVISSRLLAYIVDAKMAANDPR